jgi:hypothetical protein
MEDERKWEGWAGCHTATDLVGFSFATLAVRAFCDPCIYREGDKTYLLYSIKGEYGIAIAEVKN